MPEQQPPNGGGASGPDRFPPRQDTKDGQPPRDDADDQDDTDLPSPADRDWPANSKGTPEMQCHIDRTLCDEQPAPPLDASLEQEALPNQAANTIANDGAAQRASQAVNSLLSLPPRRETAHAGGLSSNLRPASRRPTVSGLRPVNCASREEVSPLSQAPPPLGSWTDPTSKGRRPSLEALDEPFTPPAMDVPTVLVTEPDDEPECREPSPKSRQHLSAVVEDEDADCANCDEINPRRRVRFNLPDDPEPDPGPPLRSQPESPSARALLAPSPLYRQREEGDPEERPSKHRRVSVSGRNSERPYLPRGSEGVPTEGPPPLFADSTRDSHIHGNSEGDHQPSEANGPSVAESKPQEPRNEAGEQHRGDTEDNTATACQDKNGSREGPDHDMEDADGESDTEEGQTSLTVSEPTGGALASDTRQLSVAPASGAPPEISRPQSVLSERREFIPSQDQPLSAASETAPRRSRAWTVTKEHRPEGQKTKRETAASTSLKEASGGKSASDVSGPRQGGTSEVSISATATEASVPLGNAQGASQPATEDTAAQALLHLRNTAQPDRRVVTGDGALMSGPPIERSNAISATTSVKGTCAHAGEPSAGRPPRLDASAAGSLLPRRLQRGETTQSRSQAQNAGSSGWIGMSSGDHIPRPMSNAPSSAQPGPASHGTATATHPPQPGQARGITIPSDRPVPPSNYRVDGDVRQLRHNILPVEGYSRLTPLYAEGVLQKLDTDEILPVPDRIGEHWFQWVPCWNHVSLPDVPANASLPEVQARARKIMGVIQAQAFRAFNEWQAAARLRLQPATQPPQSDSLHRLADPRPRVLGSESGQSSHSSSPQDSPHEAHSQSAQLESHQSLRGHQRASGPVTLRQAPQPSQEDYQQSFSRGIDQRTEQNISRAPQPSSSCAAGPGNRRTATPYPSVLLPPTPPQPTGEHLVRHCSEWPIDKGTVSMFERYPLVYNLHTMASLENNRDIRQLLQVASQRHELKLALEGLLLLASRSQNSTLEQLASVVRTRRHAVLRLLQAFGGLDEYKNTDPDSLRQLTDFLERRGE